MKNRAFLRLGQGLGISLSDIVEDRELLAKLEESGGRWTATGRATVFTNDPDGLSISLVASAVSKTVVSFISNDPLIEERPSFEVEVVTDAEADKREARRKAEEEEDQKLRERVEEAEERRRAEEEARLKAAEEARQRAEEEARLAAEAEAKRLAEEEAEAQEEAARLKAEEEARQAAEAEAKRIAEQEEAAPSASNEQQPLVAVEAEETAASTDDASEAVN